MFAREARGVEFAPGFALVACRPARERKTRDRFPAQPRDANDGGIEVRRKEVLLQATRKRIESMRGEVETGEPEGAGSGSPGEEKCARGHGA